MRIKYNEAMKERKKVFVFDLDGTLFETSAKIQGSPTAPNFIEFGDSRKLLTESIPLPMLYFAKKIFREGHTVYILTARKRVISNAIYTLLLSYGIKPEIVFCVGDSGLNVPYYKAEILEQIKGFDEVYYYDDELPNLILAQKTGVRVFQVSS